jgi:hypothetical protein
MSYWVLTQTGAVISRTTLQRITNLEKKTDEVRTSTNEFDVELVQGRGGPDLQRGQTESRGLDRVI